MSSVKFWLLSRSDSKEASSTLLEVSLVIPVRVLEVSGKDLNCAYQVLGLILVIFFTWLKLIFHRLAL